VILGRNAGRALLWVGAGAATLWLLHAVWGLFWVLAWPVLAGGLMALLAEGPVRVLVRHGLPRGLAAAAVVVGLVAGAAAALFWLAIAVARELLRLLAHLPAIAAAAARAMERLGQRAAGTAGRLPPGLRAALQQEMARGAGAAGPVLQEVLMRAQRAATGLSDALFGLLLAVLTAYFLCRDRPRLAAFLEAHLPGPAAPRVHQVLAAVRASAWGLLRAELLLAATTFGVSLAGLLLIGAPYALLAALGAALLDFLPVVGPGLLFVPWIAGAAAEHLPGAAVALGAVFSVVVGLRFVLTPRLLGSQVGLHPWVAAAAMYAGAKVGGLPGLLLGPPAAAVLRAVWRAGTPPEPWYNRRGNGGGDASRQDRAASR
jgi:sporulation integral membrane protein YtvI